MTRTSPASVLCAALVLSCCAKAAEAPRVLEVEGQPLGANVLRVCEALDFLGAPLPKTTVAALQSAAMARDAAKLQQLLDPHVLCIVDINPELRVKAARGPAAAALQQEGWTPVIIKVANDGSAMRALRITSAQSGPVYAGAAKGSLERERQQWLRENENTAGRTDRFLQVEMVTSPPMMSQLSGLRVEYALAAIYSSEAGKREATIAFDIGEGTQDLGFRAEVPVLFDVRPAVNVALSIRDFDGTPTTARLLFTDASGRVHPPQTKRLAPDFFFQKQIYRPDGGSVHLPPGEFTLWYGRGPEYRWQRRAIAVHATDEKPQVSIRLERWVNPMEYGYYCGDHHIHAAGCAHYTSPTVGADPEHVLQQIKGEGLNVGSVLSWGYGFDYQRQFFSGEAHRLSEPKTVLRYDMEVSGFGSAALGHICLLNLREQVYPGADGVKGWPTWTVPTLRWTKAQGGFTGYPHSGSGMQVTPTNGAARLIQGFDNSNDGRLTPDEARSAVLPEDFEKIDADHDGGLNLAELTMSLDRAGDQLPNVGIPDIGGHEIFVSTALRVCDFISAMDTARLLEWNCWYHLMNCGFPLKVAGETDFPCMSGTRVGQGRTYVQLGQIERLSYADWCAGLAAGRSYVSDGYAHALEFTVEGKPAGEEVRLAQPGRVKVRAKVAFSSETPLEIAYGGAVPIGGTRLVGDTVNFHDATGAQPYAGGKRKLELVVNGRPVASRQIAADDQAHEIEFIAEIPRSSWVAIRQFPQLHTNPVNVIVDGQPIRASRQSARWCLACIDQLWRVRSKAISAGEREAAEKAYDEARAIYRRIAAEAPEGS